MVTRRFVWAGIVALALTGSMRATTAGPDLEVTSCVFTPAAPNEADFVTVTMTFKNVGDQPAAFSSGVEEWSARIDLIGMTTTSSSGPSRGRTIAAGASFTDKREIVRPAQLAPGSHSVLVTVDPANVLRADVNRANNVKTCAFVVAAGGVFPPDLRLQGLRAEVTPTTSRNVALIGTIKNIGKSAATIPAGVLVAVEAFGTVTTTQQEVLAPGATRSFRVSPDHLIQPGAYRFRIEVDPLHHVPGEIRDNNIDEVATRVLYSGRPREVAPDLIIESCMFSPPVPSRSQDLRLKVT